MKYFLSALLLWMMSLRTHAQDIVLNTTFGNNGVVVKSVDKKDNVFYEQAQSVIELPDEKFLASVDINSTTVLIRGLRNGTLDKAYGKDGFSNPLNASLARAARRADGKVMVVGISLSENGPYLVAGRYNENGSFDTGFGNKGVKTIPLYFSGAALKKIIVQKDGKILLGGTTTTQTKFQGFIMRLKEDGSPDPSFAANGLLMVNVPGVDQIADIALSGTHILAAATSIVGSQSDFAIMQYLENGSPDLNFGTQGVVKVSTNTNDRVEAMALQSDGKIIVAGSAFNTYVTLIRCLPNGKLDNTFNRNGIALVVLGLAPQALRSLVIDSNDKIIIAGFLQGSTASLVFDRLTADGNTDLSYGDQGKKSLDFDQANPNISEGMLTKDGSFIGAGFYYNYTISNATYDYLLVRVKANGQPDETFNNNGLLIGYVPGKYSYFVSPNLFPNGEILVRYFALATEANEGLMRLSSDGKQRMDFGKDGLLKIASEYFCAMPDKRIEVFNVGVEPPANQPDVVMKRYTEAGRVDSLFGVNGVKRLGLTTTITLNGTLPLPDGNILLTGTADYGSDHRQIGYMARVKGDGKIDQQFGAGGPAIFNYNELEYPYEPTLQPDGKILVRGFVYTRSTQTSRSFIRRFTSAGRHDESFGKKGIILVEPNGYFAKVMLQSNGKLLTTGSLRDENQQRHFLLSRFNEDGSPDKSFGVNGSVIIPSMIAVVLKNDKIIINTTADDNSKPAFMLLNPDGSLDESFGTNGIKNFELGSVKYSFYDLITRNDTIIATGIKTTGFDQEGIIASFVVKDKPISDTAVTAFTLVNASTDKDIQSLNDGDVLDLTHLPKAGLNIRANTNPAKVGSVVFELSGPQTYKHVENGAPYALFRNIKGNYDGGAFEPGDYVLTATPYSKAKGQGTKGTPLTIHFKVVYDAAVTRFVLVNAQTGKDMLEIKDGDKLTLATLPTGNFSIRAYTSPDTVGSILFDLQGQQVHHATENLAPYALFGGNKKTYSAWAAEAGNYILTATPHSAANGKGTKGKGYTVHFTFTTMMPVVTSTTGKQTKLLADNNKVSLSLFASPNPFTSLSTVRFSIPTSGNITVSAYNATGAEVARLYEGKADGGKEYSIPLNGKQLPAGIYLLRLSTEKQTTSLKVILSR